jgi:hypothetical protein
MKHLPSYPLLAFLALFSNAQAVTITEIQDGVSVYANSVEHHSGKYFDQTFVYDDTLTINKNFSSPLSRNEINTAVTGSDLMTYAWTPDYNLPTGTGQNDAYLDLRFATDIFNGDGADLVLFFAGTGTKFKTETPGEFVFEPFQFSLDVGADGILETDAFGATTFGVTTSETSDIYGGKFFASYAMIDLDNFVGFDTTTSLGDIRIYLGDGSMPALAAVGAYHTQAAVVPLPLPALLFSSGLLLLSWMGRRKTA